MPLLRIETRPKSSDTAGRRPAAAPPQRSRSSATPAIAAGVLLGIVVIAGVVAFAMGRRSGAPAAQQTASAAPTAVITETFGTAGSSLPSADASLAPINQDFPREATVALVNNVSFTMGQLETAVRIGRTLGTLSGDAVPDYTSPEMRTFQIQMLRRQVDIILMKQAFQARSLEDPGLPIDSLISAYLERVGATQDDLAKQMASNGVTTEALQAWFTDSQQVNLFVQEALMQGKDQAQREEITRAWLDQQWQAAQIYVNFYDPDSETWSPSSGTPAATPTQ